MRIVILLLSLVLSVVGTAQNRSDQGTLSLSPQQGQTHDIALFEGDQLRWSVSAISPKKAEVGLMRLYDDQEQVLLEAQDFESRTFEFSAKKAGVFTLWFQNLSADKAQYEATYSVISTHKKVPTIAYRQKKDTTYGFAVKQWITHHKKDMVPVQEEGYYLNSTSNALVKGGKNRILIPVQLPEGTQEWYYSFTASRDKEQMENTLASFQLASQLSTYADNDQKLQQAISTLSPPPGANICDVYVMRSEAQAMRFKDKEEFSYHLPSSRENFKSGVVRVKDRRDAYIGIRNPDNLYGIHVGLSITALVLQEDRRLEEVQIPIIRAYKKGYIKK